MNESTKKTSKSGECSKDNPRLPQFVLRCNQLQKSTKLNRSPLSEQLREWICLFSSFLQRDDISEMSHFIWTSWPWFISMTLSFIYIKKREELGRDPKGWINVRNQFWTPFSPLSVADYFYFSLNCSNDKVKFQFHCSWWYTTSVSWS